MKPPESRALPGAFHNELLTGEEIRALLSPIHGAAPEKTDPVLLLTPRPEEADQISAYLQKHGVPVVAATNCYAALDLFRADRYFAFVAATEALPPDLPRYLDRLREVDPSIPLYFVQDPDGSPPREGTTVERPLADDSLAKLFHFAPTASPQEAKRFEREPGEGGSEAEAAHSEIDAQDSSGSAEGPLPDESASPRNPPKQVPDALLAVKSLLEAKVGGEDVKAGLRRWAESDPSIRGLVEFQEESAQWNLRASASEREERRRMVLLLLDSLGDSGTISGEPAAVGPFSVFPLPLRERSSLALWHENRETARELVAKLEPFLSLIGMLPDPVLPVDAGSARERFVSLLESRMRAAERADGQLGVLLMQTALGDNPLQIYQILRALLRGGDWIEVVGNCVYVILDQPGKKVFAALGERLRQLPGVDRLQVVALGWNPTEGGADKLVERAERILEEGGGGEVLPGVSD